MKQAGFTLAELMIVIILAGMFSVAIFTFFKSSLFGYLDMQKTASNFTDLAAQSQRIAQVVRGSTNITDAQDYSAEMYAYFYPTDTYVSLIRYYLSTDNTKLMADVTPMTSNPPVGTQMTANKKTYTIIGTFKRQTGVKLFEYLSSSGATLAQPISDLHAVKGVRINLASQSASPSGDQVMTVDVNLRNKKTNL